MTRTIGIVLASFVGGCSPAVVDTLCQTTHQISFSAQRAKTDPGFQPETADNKFDTKETVDEIRAHNAVIKRLCP